jgi:probable HAF family extracellular repeat protein
MRLTLTVILLAMPFAVATPVAGSSFTYTTISVPGIAGPQVTGIDAAGQISGYGGAGGVLKGFILENQSSVTTIFQPNSGGTEALGLNDVGQIVGTYFDSIGGHHAFVGTAAALTAVNVPGAASTTEANGINNAGQIVGNFSSASLIQGFLDSSGTFTTILVPGSSGTQALGINGAGQIVGTYFDSSGEHHAFVYAGGAFTFINVPNAASTTMASGINNSGEIVGTFSTGTEFEGFLDDDGVFGTISFPGSSGTQLLGINDAGQIVGDYFDNRGVTHPFLATPATAVPEPDSMVLIILSLLSLAFWGISKHSHRE